MARPKKNELTVTLGELKAYVDKAYKMATEGRPVYKGTLKYDSHITIKCDENGEILFFQKALDKDGEFGAHMLSRFTIKEAKQRRKW